MPGVGGSPEIFLRGVLWALAILGSTLVVLVLGTGLLQVQEDRRNRRRIEAYQRWEEALPGVVFGSGEVPDVFRPTEALERGFLRTFLQRFRASLGGVEGKRLGDIYRAAQLDQDLARRLRSRWPRVRAQAALEVQAFDAHEHLAQVVRLLDDPVPFVSYAAARALARSGQPSRVAPVVDWVLREELLQHERLAALLEDFGPSFLDWLEPRIPPPPKGARGWRLFALLVAKHKPHDRLPVILSLLQHPVLDVQVAALKALTALGDPEAFPAVDPFTRAEEPVLRIHAAWALGALGGAGAVPDLLALLADPAYEVRRTASLALHQLGHAGISALSWVVQDPGADPFARDMAAERLEWAEQRGRL